MPENIVVAETLAKADKYKALLPSLKALLEGESDSIANMAYQLFRRSEERRNS